MTTSTRSTGHEPKSGFKMEPLYWFLAAVPIAVVLEVMHAPAVWIFIIACTAIIPLAGLMGRATESLASTLGAGIGGLLNATFGNAAELIIALMLLLKGPEMYPLVKASITGSIIGNILLVLGAAMLAGGLRYKRQTFNATAAGMGATLLALATAGLIVPTIYFYLFKAGPTVTSEELATVNFLSEEIAAILALTYGLSLIFSLKTHSHLTGGTEAEEEAHSEHHWSRKASLIVLLASTALIALMSEFLVGSVEHAAESMGMNAVFVGVIVVAVIGNAAEHSTAILVAMKNKMDLSVNIAIGSSIQIALFVAPVLVFASMIMGHPAPMDLHFSPMEVIAVIVSVGIVSLVSQDGECHWMEGVMLVALYVILGLAFYHLPATQVEAATAVPSLAP